VGAEKNGNFSVLPHNKKSARSALQGAAGALRGAQRRRRRRTAGARNLNAIFGSALLPLTSKSGAMSGGRMID